MYKRQAHNIAQRIAKEHPDLMRKFCRTAQLAGKLSEDVYKRQVQGIVLLYACVGIIGLILGDVLMVLIDPCINFGKKEGGR